ncbi:MAG: CAP domain-containing protein [Planctomycetota bacterium]
MSWAVLLLPLAGCASGLTLPDAPDLPSPRSLLSRGGGRATSAPAPRSAPPVAAPADRPPADVALEDRRTFDEANRVRVQWGLRPFRWNDRLYAAAKAHSEEQERFDYMGHGSPDPARDDLADRLRIAGYGPASGWAEVVARGYEGPVSVMNGWMNSKGHRKILTDPRLEEAAFARVGSSFTGNFGTPAPR